MLLAAGPRVFGAATSSPMAGGGTASVRLFLLGRFRLTVDGEPRKLAALPRALPLLALVAARGAQPMQREALAFALWPDEDERDARANLRRHIHSVRKALPADCDPFVVDDVHIAWNSATSLWCDVVAFERERAAKRFDAALDLYGGALLEESLEEQMFAERERLQNIFMTLGLERVRSARAAGDFERAIEIAQRAASADQWREDVIRTLIELRYEAGDRAGALDTYDRFARRLKNEMSVEPMPETIAVRARVAASNANGVHPSFANARRSNAPLELPFVERERELSELATIIDFANPQRSAAAFVVGEAGIGKTRLLAEFARCLDESGVRVAVGGIPAGGERSPYRPLVSALQPFSAWLQTNLDAPRAALLGSLLEPGSSDEPERSRLLVFDAFAAAFEAIANDAPLLVLCEDAHWAGDATASALAFLARRLARSRVAIAVTYRSEQVGHDHAIARVARELIDANAACAIAVRRLSDNGVRTAIGAAIGGDASIVDASVDEIARLCDGNPFFLGEILRDRLESSGDAATLTPGTVDEVIEARLERLDDRTRSFLEIAAVAGDAFALDLVRTSAGLSESDARSAIDELLDRAIVRDGGRRLGYRFAFAHHLIRSHVYESMPPGVRDRRHLRIATVLERRADAAPGDAAADLAHHFDRGGDHERAARYSLAAARRFATVGAFDEAATHADRGIALARDPELRFDLLLARERVAEARGDRERQAEILEAAEALANELGDGARTFDVLLRRCVNLRTRGLRSEEKATVDRLIVHAERLGDPVRSARALLQRASTLHLLGSGDLRADLRRAVDLLEAGGDTVARVEAHCEAIKLLAGLRRPLEQAEYLAAARRISAESFDAECEIRVLEASAFARYLSHPLEAIADGERLVPILAARGERERLADAYQRLAMGHTRLGRTSVALDYCARARRLFSELGKPQGLGAIANVVGMSKLRLGAISDALEGFDTAYEIFTTLGDLRGRSVARSNRSYCCFMSGDFAAGLRAAQHALEFAIAANDEAYACIAYSNLGANQLGLGEIDAALVSMRMNLQTSGLGNPADRIDDLAQYCVALVRAGEVAEANRVAAEILEVRSAASEPQTYDHFAAYAVFCAARLRGDSPAADDALRDAAYSLERFLASLDERADRAVIESYTETAVVLRALEEAGLDFALDARRTQSA